jgi:ribokinase
VRARRRPASGETIIGTSLSVFPGGKGANQAVVAARLGAKVAMLGSVGSDAYAAEAMRLLVDSGANVSYVARSAKGTGIAIILVEESADNSIILIPGANQDVTEEWVTGRSDVISRAEVVVAQMEIPPQAVARTAALCSGRFVLNLAPAVPADPAVIRRADPLVVNEHEAVAALSFLTGASTDPPSDPIRDERAVLRELLAAGVPSVVITLGERGALVGSRDQDAITAIPAIAVRAVDTTGAGDAFVGALAAQLSAGADLVRACREATRVAAWSVQYPGAQPSYPMAGDALPQFPDS